MEETVKKMIEEFLDGSPLRKDWTFEAFEMMAINTIEKFESFYDTQLWVEEHIKADWTEPLYDEGVAFLMNHFNITADINALSDKEFGDLYDKVCAIEIDEAHKADKMNTNISEYGAIASDIVSYMANQWREGGRRYISKRQN